MNNLQSHTMVFTFNNYFVELTKQASPDTYGVKILKVTGPAHFNRELIVESNINSIDSLTEFIQTYIPSYNFSKAV